jgi:class 3 adenylate cyclase/DNA-binding transcriptional MerR regulator
MIASIDLLAKTGISRATLNNYIAMYLLPKPEVKRQSLVEGEPPTTLGYFPDWSLDRIHEITRLKKDGMSMAEIQAHFLGDKIREENHTKNVNKQEIKDVIKENTLNNSGKSLNLSIDNIPYAAYMFDYKGNLFWLNDMAKKNVLTNEIPDHISERSLFPILFNWANKLNDIDKVTLIKAHISPIKHRLQKDGLANSNQALNSLDMKCLLESFDISSSEPNTIMHESIISNPDNITQSYRLISISFREGIFMFYAKERDNIESILGWLSQRDSVIKSLLEKRLPVLTPLAVMVADLQNSIKICSELPPEEYFELINSIWVTLDPIFRKYYGTYGKHTGDGMLYYFFPQPDQNYLMNALACAFSIKEAMKKINQEWALKKGWNNQLYMNIGLNSGEEWLGVFKSNVNFEFVVLGETINTAARLSDLARFGKIWATKTLVSKLDPVDREKIVFGVDQKGLEGQHFVKNTYSQVSSLMEIDGIKTHKLMDISSVAVTEIVEHRH